jgi:hypothetical protein
MKGLEPPRLSAPDPKSGAATNYATSAKNQAQRYELSLKNPQLHQQLFLITGSYLNTLKKVIKLFKIWKWKLRTE